MLVATNSPRNNVKLSLFVAAVYTFFTAFCPNSSTSNTLTRKVEDKLFVCRFKEFHIKATSSQV